MAQSNQPTDPNWQQSTLEKILMENIKENRRKRRWGIFFKLLFAAYLVLVLLILLPMRHTKAPNAFKPHTAVIKINGAIMADDSASADNVTKSLRKAFKDDNTRGVILEINSPGGSPVQASEIYNTIMAMRHKYPHKKIYAVCTDMCASAAYYIASASNDIYANPSSIVGSIGVLLNGFGFTGTMEKLGITRRLITSGSEKGFLDPFSPLKPEDKKFAQNMLNIVHQQFIKAVEKGRGKRLKNSEDLFSGLAWTGEQAKQMGLIDGFGSVYFVAKTKIGNTNIVNYTHKPSFIQQLSRGMGASFASTLASDLGISGSPIR